MPKIEDIKESLEHNIIFSSSSISAGREREREREIDFSWKRERERERGEREREREREERETVNMLRHFLSGVRKFVCSFVFVLFCLFVVCF